MNNILQMRTPSWLFGYYMAALGDRDIDMDDVRHSARRAGLEITGITSLEALSVTEIINIAEHSDGYAARSGQDIARRVQGET